MKIIPAKPSPDLFEAAATDLSGDGPEEIKIPDAEVLFYRNFFTEFQSNALYQEIYAGIPWRQERIRMYGREIDVPRFTCWVGDERSVYTYSGITSKPEPWTPELLLIKKKIEAVSGLTFNSVLLNLYREGRDSVSWHSDDEPELGRNPVIGSVSFGETRRFQLRHRVKKDLRCEVHLSHGSYLLMRGSTQHFWLHQIPKETKPCRPRINLTFRVIKNTR